MILNISGRTDIVGFYMPWLINRFKEGFFDVRNPFYPKMISRIKLSDVDGIVFCTKNPLPLLENIDAITVPFLLQVTITPYKRDIEPGVIDKTRIIDAIKEISNIIGKDKISVRFDPIFINDTYDVNYHVKAFEKLCKSLNGCVNRMIVSFIDDYKNVRKNMKVLNLRDLTEEEYKTIGTNFSRAARDNGMAVFTCFEKRNLSEYGFSIDECVSRKMAELLTGKTNFKKWTARRGGMCGCVEMVDIGVYNTCKHFCKYCYANFDENKVKENTLKHDVNSSLLIGKLENDDIIKERKNTLKSNDKQLSFFQE